MATLNWGKGIGLNFIDNSDYYYCLGYLTNRSHGIDVYTHDNGRDGAWAGQGKLHNRTNISNHPATFQHSFRQSGDDRLSVSAYVENLVYNHNFSQWYDPTGENFTYYRFPESMENVLSTVPIDFREDFISGFNL